ncbi:MAG: response regulator [Desulfobacterales bacterium]|nr:response regulator [Desulfobacterales bacterium]
MDVLIVEDDPANADWMQDMMTRWQHSAALAASGREALKRLGGKGFDLILLDIFLPDVQGDELIPRIKALCPRGHIVTMTGFNTRELETRIRKQGITYYMIKPFDLKHLRSIVEHIATKNGSRAAA